MKYKKFKLKNNIIIIIIVFMSFVLSYGQDDTFSTDNNTQITEAIETSKEALVIDSDSLFHSQKYYPYSKSDSLQYSGDKSFYNLTTETISLAGNAKIVYQDIFIEADSLYLSLEDKTAFSTGDALIRQQGQVFLSRDIKMDVESKRGILKDASGSMEQGFIYGSAIRKVDDDVYDVDNGIFTTCDDINPHYYLKSSRLRIYLDDTVSAKPVVYYVNHFPVMALPFASFSIKRGRNNGFLIPQPGWNNNDGKYLKNIAYYYAYKEYFENKVAFDFFEKRGWNFNLTNRYIVRYLFNGKVDFNYRKRDYNTTTTSDWSLVASHSQTLKNNASLIANINYATSKTIWDSSTDIDDRLTESISSSATYSKGFDNSTLNVSAYYNENFITNSKSVTLPTVRYNQSTTPFYELIGLSSKDVEDSWWNSLSYNYGLVATHYGTINDEDSDLNDLIWGNETSIDSLGNEKIVKQHNLGALHNFSFSFSPTLSPYFNISQSVNFKEAWFDRSKTKDSFSRGHSLSFNTTSSTKLYGLKTFNTPTLKAIRHVITPRVSFAYTPDYSENDELYSFSGISLASGSRRRMINVSLNQIWQIKYYDKISQSNKKINNLLSMNSSFSYDLEKETNKLSRINHSLKLSPNSFNYNDINFSYNNSISFNHDFYNKSWGNLNLENWKFNQTLTMSGNFSYFNYFPKNKNPLVSGQRVMQDSIKFADLDWDYYSSKSEKKNWTINLTHALSFKEDLLNPQSNSLNMSLNMYITNNWHFEYSNRFDIENQDIISQNIALKRDLHCWNLTFDYKKSNDIWEYKVVFSNNKLSDILKFPFEARS